MLCEAENGRIIDVLPEEGVNFVGVQRAEMVSRFSVIKKEAWCTIFESKA